MVDIIEDGGRCAKMLLPLVVLDTCLLKSLKDDHLFIQLLDHFIHIGVLVQVLWKYAFLSKLFDFLVELRNHLLKFLLESLVL